MQAKPKFLKCVQLNRASKFKSETNSLHTKSLYTRKPNHISQANNVLINIKISKSKSLYAQKNLFIKKSKYSAYINLPQNNDKRKQELKKQNLKDFTVIGVFQEKIVVCYNNKLQIFGYFDQHAMHQRIRYEYYLNQIKMQHKQFVIKSEKKWNQNIIQKDAKTPKQVIGTKISCYSKINFEEKEIILTQKDQLKLQFLGFKLLVKQKQFYLSQYPQILQKRFPLEVYIQIAKQIIFNKISNIIQIPKKLDDIIAQSSCKSAYKFNDKISNLILSQMIIQLSDCDYAFYCVHGRPTFFVK